MSRRKWVTLSILTTSFTVYFTDTNTGNIIQKSYKYATRIHKLRVEDYIKKHDLTLGDNLELNYISNYSSVTKVYRMSVEDFIRLAEEKVIPQDEEEN